MQTRQRMFKFTDMQVFIRFSRQNLKIRHITRISTINRRISATNRSKVTIRYDTIRCGKNLRALKSWRDDHVNVAHGKETKSKEKKLKKRVAQRRKGPGNSPWRQSGSYQQSKTVRFLAHPVLPPCWYFRCPADSAMLVTDDLRRSVDAGWFNAAALRCEKWPWPGRRSAAGPRSSGDGQDQEWPQSSAHGHTGRPLRLR